MVTIMYSLILLIDVKWHLHATIGSMSIQLCRSGLRMHQLTKFHMNQLLGDLIDICTLVYFDDIFIFSCTKENYQKYVNMVFDKLAKFKYHVKHKKYKQFSKKVKFLGHTVSDAGVGVI